MDSHENKAINSRYKRVDKETEGFLHTTPGVDTQILLDEEHNKMSNRVDYMILAINEAMESCTEKQEFIYRKMTGIKADGEQVEGWTEAEVARSMGVKRDTVHQRFLEAENRVLRSITKYAISSTRS